MDLQCAHIVLNASDVARAREFYIDRLGFDVLESHPQSFAFRAGHVRFTVTPNGAERSDDDPCNSSIIFETTDIEETVAELRGHGIEFESPIEEAPGFMKFIAFSDPDRNPLMIAQYSRDPLKQA